MKDFDHETIATLVKNDAACRDFSFLMRARSEMAAIATSGTSSGCASCGGSTSDRQKTDALRRVYHQAKLEAGLLKDSQPLVDKLLDYVGAARMRVVYYQSDRPQNITLIRRSA